MFSSGANFGLVSTPAVPLTDSVVPILFCKLDFTVQGAPQESKP